MKFKSIGSIFRFLNKNKAFTLVEMMITVLIFSIIIGTTTGVFVSAIRLQKYSLAYQQLLNQTSYVMEYMSRAIRMAKKDKIGCIDESNYYEGINHSIKFATYHNECWGFFLEDSTKRLKAWKETSEGISKYYLTSDDFDVTSFNVVVSGDGTADSLQPRVTIFMEVRGRGSGYQPKIKIQTTISQRNLDVLP